MAEAAWWQHGVRGRTTTKSIKNTQRLGITESEACKGSSAMAVTAAAAAQRWQRQLGGSTASGAAIQ
jgi:hypothetical protein